MLQRLYAPAGISRYYFLFGRPIPTSRKLYNDRAAAADVYARIQQSVADCITYLLEARERDPYRNTLKRTFLVHWQPALIINKL